MKYGVMRKEVEINLQHNSVWKSENEDRRLITIT